MALSEIFRRKSEEVTGEWRRLHNEELYDVYFSTKIFRVIKSSRINWVGHVARMGCEQGHTGYRLANWKARDYLEDLGADGA
jgi:hypothetical protein